MEELKCQRMLSWCSCGEGEAVVHHFITVLYRVLLGKTDTKDVKWKSKQLKNEVISFKKSGICDLISLLMQMFYFWL